MKKRKNIKVESASGSPFLLDAFVPEDASTCPVVVFAHGFKGFKDWGCWDLVAKEFVEAGYAFVKFNFSHNGTTPEAPQDFADLDKFGNNNFTKELQDLDAVLDWVEEEANRQGSIEIDSHHISLIGHSRGGGISIIKAAQNERVKALITWASVARLDYGWHEKDHYIREWKEKGVQYIYNGRTKQMMPLYYQLYENFEQHKEAYDISSALQKRKDLPMLIVHGTADPAVPLADAQLLKQWKPDAHLLLIEEADHVFGAKHPWAAGKALPVDTQRLCAESISFLAGLR